MYRFHQLSSIYSAICVTSRAYFFWPDSTSYMYLSLGLYLNTGRASPQGVQRQVESAAQEAPRRRTPGKRGVHRPRERTAANAGKRRPKRPRSQRGAARIGARRSAGLYLISMLHYNKKRTGGGSMSTLVFFPLNTYFCVSFFPFAHS